MVALQTSAVIKGVTDAMMTMQPNYYMTLYPRVTRALTFDLPVWFTPVQNNGDMQLFGFTRGHLDSNSLDSF